MSCFLKRLTKMFIVFILVTFTTQPASRAESKKAIAISISLPSTTFKKGDPILLRVFMQNKSDHMLLVRRDRPAALKPIVITSPDGKVVSVRHPAAPGSRVSAMGGGMQKGESYSEVVNLDKCFSIEDEGSYSVRYEMTDPAGEVVTSDVISFTVTK